MTPRHPYTLIHALAASAALGVLVFSQGVAAFWQNFVYGLKQVMTPQVLQQNLLMSTLFFGTLLLVLWGTANVGSFLNFIRKVTRLRQQQEDAPIRQQREGIPIRHCEAGGAAVRRGNLIGTEPTQALPENSRIKAIKFATICAPALTLIALGLNWLGAHAIKWCTGIEPSDQELVKCFADGNYSLTLRAALVLVVLFQAPLLEEPIFRGVIFRGFAKSLPLWAAVLLSGGIFALVHVNAASFIALWFLGVSFALLYHRTGSILAPMTAHFLFNATNLALLFLFPEISSK